MNFSASPPICGFRDLEFSEEIRFELFSLLEDQEFSGALSRHALPVRSKILLHGPSGCGKTSVAHALAQSLDMKVVAISSAEIIASHLGESERNAAAVVQFASQNRCVVLLDEFDSLGSARSGGGGGASSSLDRLVNVLLMDLEKKRPLGLIVACTNLMDSIDQALLRRFDLVLEIPPASQESLRRLAEKIIAGRFGIKAEEILRRATTPAQVVAVAQQMLRRAVIGEERAGRAGELVALPGFEHPKDAAAHIRKQLEARGKGRDVPCTMQPEKTTETA